MGAKKHRYELQQIVRSRKSVTIDFAPAQWAQKPDAEPTTRAPFRSCGSPDGVTTTSGRPLMTPADRTGCVRSSAIR